MSITLKNVGSGFKRTALNSNFETIEEAINGSVLTKDGETQLEAALDFNSNRAINVADGVSGSDAATLNQLNALVAGSESISSLVQARESQLGSEAVANVFTLTGITYAVGVNTLSVYRNGQRLEKSVDYTETSSSSLTLTFTPNSGDRFVFITNDLSTSEVTTTAAITHTDNGTDYNLSNYLQERQAVNVKDFGAVGDGVTDDSAAFIAANAIGGKIFVPYTATGYKIGTGTENTSPDTDTTIEVGDNTHWTGEAGVTLIHGAATTGLGNFLFAIEDASNASIRGFTIDGQATSSSSQARVGIALRGVVSNILVEDIHCHDHANFSIQYADADTVASTAKMTNVRLKRIKIDGYAGLTGAGSGMDFFPRTTESSAPASKNLWIDDCDIDVSQNGNTTTSTHGPQCLKINNTENVFISNVKCKGGDVANIVMTNGTKNAYVTNCIGDSSELGLNITTDTSIAVNRTKGITVDGWKWSLNGVTATNGDGVRVKGAIQGLEMDRIELLDGHFRIKDNYTTDSTDFSDTTLEAWRFGSVKVENGNFIIDTASNASQTDIEGLVISKLTLKGGSTANTGRAILNPTNWALVDCQIDHVEGRLTDNDLVSNGGTRVNIDKIVSIDQNPDNDANSWTVSDTGTNNSYGEISVIGTANNADEWLNKSSGGGISIKKLSGTVSGGIRLANQEAQVVPSGSDKVISATLDLSGSAVDTVEFLAEDSAYYVAGISFIYTEASSADAGVVIRVGNGTASTSYLSKASEVSKAIGDTKSYINTTGTDNFTTRSLAIGDYLTIGTAGGKTGTGEVKVQVSLIKAA